MKTVPALAAILFLYLTPAPAAELEVPGLIVTRAVTSVGQKFCRDFSEHWTDNKTNLIIIERPSARWGSIMTIRYNQDIVFQTIVSPVMRNYDAIILQAVASVQEEIQKRIINQALLQTGDLSSDEF
ncbi:CsgE family curli-type amyloid fiber assembly protein [Pseudocitrobacter cyperus]|uniref:Curli production assembly/transport component CsgE n=1 Tax=Pseudocitrobacter cyperus TaxID=3112843 RepID=A0ABV0HFC2_9ENTR